MQIRPLADFESTLPYDGIEDEEGDRFIQYPGKNIALVLQEILARLGCRVGEIENLDFKGWEFDFGYRRLRLECRATMIDNYLVVFYDPSFWRRLFKRRHPHFVELLSTIGDELAGDSRFVNVRWFTDDDVLTEAPGTARPIVDE